MPKKQSMKTTALVRGDEQLTIADDYREIIKAVNDLMRRKEIPYRLRARTSRKIYARYGARIALRLGAANGVKPSGNVAPSSIIEKTDDEYMALMIKRRRNFFIRALAQFLAGNSAGKSIALEIERGKKDNGTPRWATEWAEILGTTPMFGYLTPMEAEKVLRKFLWENQ